MDVVVFMISPPAAKAASGEDEAITRVDCSVAELGPHASRKVVLSATGRSG